MTEKIYTIPVTDALRENSECPFCKLLSDLERSVIEFVTGPSYMERDVRENTDKRGFCDRHIGLVLKTKNVLGAALMLQTRLLRVRGELGKTAASAKKGAEQETACYVCEKINDTFDRYVDTFFYLYNHEKEIKELAQGGKGFCLPHFRMLAKKGVKTLGKSYDDFIKTLTAVQENNLTRLQGEIDFFVKKFDYRYKDEPWGDAKDAPSRLALKLTGYSDE